MCEDFFFIQLTNFIFISLASQFIPWRQNIFDSNHHAPYATKIKPMDRNFNLRLRSEGPADVIFYGYLPWELALIWFSPNDKHVNVNISSREEKRARRLKARMICLHWYCLFGFVIKRNGIGKHCVRAFPLLLLRHLLHRRIAHRKSMKRSDFY